MEGQAGWKLPGCMERKKFKIFYEIKQVLQHMLLCILAMPTMRQSR